MAETGTLKIYQNRLGPVQGKCCLENVENFCLTLFWYSPTYQQNKSLPKYSDTVGIAQLSLVSDLVVSSLKK
jgi:hypothetical protein